MKLYNVTDHGEWDEWFVSKRPAMRAFNEGKDAYQDQDGGALELVEHDIGRLTAEVACRLVKRQGFSRKATTLKTTRR